MSLSSEISETSVLCGHRRFMEKHGSCLHRMAVGPQWLCVLEARHTFELKEIASLSLTQICPISDVFFSLFKQWAEHLFVFAAMSQWHLLRCVCLSQTQPRKTCALDPRRASCSDATFYCESCWSSKNVQADHPKLTSYPPPQDCMLCGGAAARLLLPDLTAVHNCGKSSKWACNRCFDTSRAGSERALVWYCMSMMPASVQISHGGPHVFITDYSFPRDGAVGSLQQTLTRKMRLCHKHVHIRDNNFLAFTPGRNLMFVSG